MKLNWQHATSRAALDMPAVGRARSVPRGRTSRLVLIYQRTHAESSSRLASSRWVGLGTLVKYASCCRAPRTAALDVMHMPVRNPDSPKSCPCHGKTRILGRAIVKCVLLLLGLNRLGVGPWKTPRESGSSWAAGSSASSSSHTATAGPSARASSPIPSRSHRQ